MRAKMQVMSETTPVYRGRFAPSPTGPLHLGSLFCAAATWLDARSHGGVWLVRIEDIDPPRDMPGADRLILDTLAAFGLASDEPVVWQSKRCDLYEAALARLYALHRAYGCACTNSDIAHACGLLHLPKGVYPGTCRRGTLGKPVRSVRFLTEDREVAFIDRLCGPVKQNVEKEVGDFIIRRADHLWAYQLCVVVDDADQGITDVVRGSDLLASTARQIELQQALGYRTPRYLHTPLILGPDGEKLSKQRKAPAVTAEAPLATLTALWPHFGLPAFKADTLTGFWKTAVEIWRDNIPA